MRPLLAILVVLTLLAVGSAQAGEPYAPTRQQRLAAATAMSAVHSVLLAEKQRLGIWPGADIDPNRTGLVGHEFTAMTTTLGTLPYKRTPTSPDFAAGMVNTLAGQGIGPGDVVLLIMSGSFPGADFATLIALETLGTDVILVPTLGSSQWGANDPELTILDMLALAHDAGLVATTPIAGAIGGNGAIGSNMDPAVLPLLRDTFARHRVPLAEDRDLSVIVANLAQRVTAAAAGKPLALMIKAGGSAIGLGANPDDCDIATGFQPRPPLCATGVPGLLHVLGSGGTLVLNMVDMQKLAATLHVAVDPQPLPVLGDNRLVYGEP